MKRTPLLLVALVPFMAVAAGSDSKSAQVDKQKLRNAVAATDLIGQDVNARNGEEFGEIETIIFKDDGSIAYYEVEPDMDMYTDASVAADADADLGADDAGFEGDVDADLDADRVAADTSDVIRIKPEKIKFGQDGEVTLDADPKSLMQMKSEASTSSASGKQFKAGDIIGMQVDLADEESFGEVEEILISEKGDKAVALVVDNWDGLDKERRALPVELKSVNEEEETIRYDLSKNQLGDESDFDLDEYTDRM